MEKIITKEQIADRVQELAQQISIDHMQSSNSLPPVMICVLNGALHFFSDLTRMMSIHCEIDCIRLKSYEGQDNSGGVTITKDLELDLQGKRVYIVDDILDTGATMIEALHMVNSRRAADVKVVTLLKRKSSPLITDFYAFEIEDQWVVGYGLDDNGIKRELLDIYEKK
jgi:hypoxanthine phosphoribosyltransferase